MGGIRGGERELLRLYSTEKIVATETQRTQRKTLFLKNQNKIATETQRTQRKVLYKKPETNCSYGDTEGTEGKSY